MSQVKKTSRDIEEEILKAIRHLGQTRGSSSADILRFLTPKKLLNMTTSEIIVQSNLNNAVDKGLLKKLSNGKYKINETARRRKSRSRSRSRAKSKRRSRSRKRSGSKRRRRSSSGRRRKRSSSRRRRKRSISGSRHKSSSSGSRRKRSISRRRRSRRRTKTPEEQE